MELFGLVQCSDGRWAFAFNDIGEIITYPLRALAVAHIENHRNHNDSFKIVRYSASGTTVEEAFPAEPAPMAGV